LNIYDILTKWIEIAGKRGMPEKVQSFWLLRDYIEGIVWSESFYKEHAREAWECLVGLDDSKPEVKQVLTELLPVVKGYMT
jgi:hypothetical protein